MIATSSYCSPTRALTDGESAVRSWRLLLDGEPREARHLVLEAPALGTLTYGMTRAGHDGWTFHEASGGVVIVLHSRRKGQLQIGLIEQERPNQGGRVLNAPRGFLDPGESHLEAALRELGEEVGLAYAAEASLLDGAPANPNSAFFETAQAGEGVRFVAIAVPEALLIEDGRRLVFAARALRQDDAVKQSRLAERIGRAVFVPWFEAATVGDMFTNAAVARLLAALGAGP